ncbi:TIGR00282 family metallophosphoesterase [Candidatus Methylacidiphilum infernorum]|uniref:Calcineurin-like phosphoesterase n=1 Tax=Methylacidiphilum infernorum (isolate V4) TaxID=481448 RepID=B3DY68_METI4|nr:TIGR00282 family metallophosphoesterase [Candidatus Methylacidiphilum infernorum]ACD82345.1 Calcineurin-like phosphoesterase [Methylacidiphilum infernorum V4]
MKVVFFGDVVGETGRETLREAIPKIRSLYQPDFIVVNGENAAGGNGITPKITYEFLRLGIDVITLGDHAWDQKEIVSFIQDEPRLLRPINYPPGTPGEGHIIVKGNAKKLAVVCAIGRTFMLPQTENPFLTTKKIIAELKKETPCILVDFHAEATSEKIAFGRFLDGEVSAVVGTHTHVQTADETIFPGGTAYITDVGFCGAHDSVIGREIAPIIYRYTTLLPTKFILATENPRADGIFIDIDEESGKAKKIERIQLSLPSS